MKYFQILLLFIILNGTLLAQEPFKVVYFENFAPYSWEENGQMQGILIDVVNEVIHKHLGLEIIHSGYPWIRAQKMVGTGIADAFVTIPTPERKNYIEASIYPVIISTVTIFTSTGNSRIPELMAIPIDNNEGLKKFSMLGYLGDNSSRNIYKDWTNIYWLPFIDDVLKKIALGGGEIFIQTAEVTRYNIMKLGLQDKIVEVPNVQMYLSFHLCIGKKSDYVNILPEFDNILKQLEEDGKLEEIYSRYK